MNMVVCALFDTAAQVYGRPFFAHVTAQAIRSLGDEVNSSSKDTDLSRHPDDFELYLLGSFDDASGVISSHDPQFLVRARDLIRAKE